VIESNRTPDNVDVLCERCNVSARRDFRVRRKIRKVLFNSLRKLLPKFPRERKKPAQAGKIVTAPAE
jgi:hypothetical protein